MSLINDALKKAQRERATAPEHPASVTPPTGHAPAPRGELRARSNPWPALLVVLALVGGGTAVWFLKPSGQSAPVAVAANNPTPTAPATPLPAEPVAPPAPPPSLQINLPGTATPPVPAPAPVAAAPAPTPAPAAAVTPAAQPTPPAQPESLKITLQMEDPRILAFLDAARINGVRSVADDAKLLMNNKVFRAGGVVDRELGLKLVQILPNELVFEDSRGIQYRKLL